MHEDLIEFWKTAPDQQIDALLAQAPVLMHSLDDEGSIVNISDRWADLLGYDRQELVGKKAVDLLTPQSRQKALEEILPEFRRTGRSHNVEHDFVCKDGSTLPVVLSATKLVSKDGSFHRSLAILFDNRDVIIARRELAEAARAAGEASRAKSRFLAAMSHEIRTPMNSILGFAQLLLISDLRSDQRSHVKSILTAGESLMNLLTDILDLEQAEAGRMRIEPRDFDLYELLDRVADWWHSPAVEKGLRLVMAIDRSLPRVVHADPVRLEQVLNNFLANAVKFTSEGHVTLRVLPVRRNTESARIRFEVEDTGCGLTHEETQHLFQPFVRFETDFRKERGGWGLGLSICANIARRLDADLGVTSTPGQGSVLHYEADFEAAHAVVAREARPVAAPATETEGPRLRILLAEDNAPNRELMQLLLTEMGYDVTTASDGFEAVEAAITQEFDLVLMDIMMPGMDGIAAAAQIRNAKAPKCKVPIIACSANVTDEARARYLGLGMNGFVAKPVDRATLRETIESVTGAGRKPSAEARGRRLKPVS